MNPKMPDHISDGPQEHRGENFTPDPDEQYDRMRQYEIEDGINRHEETPMQEAEYETDEFGDKHKVNKPVVNFNINDQRIAEAKEEFKDIDAYKDIDAAKKAKSKLTKMRTTLSEAHKEQKAEALAFGRMLDAEKRRLLELIAEVEDPITAQLTEIKEAEARKEADRVARIAADIDEIEALVMDRQGMTLEEMQARYDKLMAIEITAEQYEEFIERAELTKQDAEMKLRISINREKERLEEEAKLAKVREEQEAEAKKLAAARAELEAERKKLADEQAAAIERAAKEKQAELDRIAAEQAEKQKAIDEENARLAKIAEQERLAKEKAEAEQRALELAPDKEKLERLAADMLAFPIPTCDSDEAIAVVSTVQGSMKRLAETVLERAGEMK